METRALLHEVADRAADWLDAVGDRPVAPASTPAELRVTDTLGDDPVPVGEVVAELEGRGVVFAGETLDTGVCHMALFTDPDGNDLMLHHRYAPTT